MPQATDLIVKNGAAVDKTFTLLNPAAGLNSPAEWALKEGTISSVFPRFSALARTTNNTSRQVQLKLRIPSSYTDTVTGLTQVASAFEFNGTVSVPNDFPENRKADAVAYFSNILATTLVKAMVQDGAPAT